MTEALTPDEIGRYARHIVLPEIGGAGQQALKAARVLVIGRAGSARPCCTISLPPVWARSGSSMTTPFRFPISSARSSTHVGYRPAEGGERGRKLVASEPACGCRAPTRSASILPVLPISSAAITSSSTLRQFRHALSRRRSCRGGPCAPGHRRSRPFDGSVTVLMPYAHDADGRQNPGYRDLFPMAPPPPVRCRAARSRGGGCADGGHRHASGHGGDQAHHRRRRAADRRLLLYDGLAARFLRRSATAESECDPAAVLFGQLRPGRTRSGGRCPRRRCGC